MHAEEKQAPLSASQLWIHWGQLPPLPAAMPSCHEIAPQIVSQEKPHLP